MSGNRTNYSQQVAAIRDSWSPDRVKLATTLWTEGFSAGQIAARLGGITRNAVIGKLNRMGFQRNKAFNVANKRAGAKVGNAARSVAAKIRREAKPPKAVALVVASHPPRAKTSETAFLVEGNPTARNWLERPGRSCSWPLDGPDGETWSCCAPTDTTYCAEHRAIATVTFKPWKPKARLAA